MKSCRICGESFSPSHYNVEICSDKCRAISNKESQKKYRENNRDKTRNSNAKYRAAREYGVTLEEYKACMATSNCCEVCGSTKELCYDHDHTTMKFRGVLCRSCNKAIGQLGDTKEGILRALKYLSK